MMFYVAVATSPPYPPLLPCRNYAADEQFYFPFAMPSERMIGNIYVYVQVDRIQGFVARVFETGEQIKFANRIEGRILPPNAVSLSLSLFSPLFPTNYRSMKILLSINIKKVLGCRLESIRYRGKLDHRPEFGNGSNRVHLFPNFLVTSSN